jgi:thiamine pyrophosphokinase
MDSADKAALQELQKSQISIELFPRDKDETDLELALNRAMELSPGHILVLAALGGRLDQTLGNIALLSNLRFSTCDVRLDDGVEEIFLCRDRAQVHGDSGDLVSLIPWQGAVSEIETKNLKWSLHRETLYPEKTRGISNEMLGTTAQVSIGSGLLLIVHRRASLDSPPISPSPMQNLGMGGE